MKMTKNRQLILTVLRNTEDGLPPHSAAGIRSILEDAFEFQCVDYNMKIMPNMTQIHRTLRELWYSGLIVGTRVKIDGYGTNCLPSWVVYYQVAEDAMRNGILAECKDVVQKVHRAKYGDNLFGAVFDMGLPPEEVKPLANKVKSLMQKTHPDKAEGFEAEFVQLQEALALIKSGIPLPVAVHQDNSMSVNARLERDFG
jgi:hypothetical protein